MKLICFDIKNDEAHLLSSTISDRTAGVLFFLYNTDRYDMT